MVSDARAMGRRAAGTARRASPGDGRSALARSGLAARGALYLILAALVIQVAPGEASPEEASRQGAIERVAQQTAGRWLILALTIGLFALVAWRLLQAATGDPVEGDDAKDRVRFAGKAACTWSRPSRRPWC